MQQVELIGERNKTMVIDATHLHEVDPADLITDYAEIKAMIRRAATIIWKNEAFTYDELAAHLNKNDVVLPYSIAERNTLFEETLSDIWHCEKELARTVLQPLPTRLRFSDNQSGELLHGIVVPLQAINFEEPGSIETGPILKLVAEEISTVIELPEKQSKLSEAEVARLIFNQLVKAAVYDTVIEIKKITASILKYYPATKTELINGVINKMVDDGYITLRNIGKKKFPRWSVVMDQATKADVIDDMREGKFQEGLDYMFT